MPKILRYLPLVKGKKQPHYSIVCHIVQKMETVYERVKDFSNDSGEVKIWFTINPTIIKEEIEEKENIKVTTQLICWLVRALFLGTKFKKFRIAQGAGGCKRYQLDLNEENLSIFKNFIKSIEKN